MAQAREGARVVITDIARQLDSVPCAMATEEDMQETVRLVEALDQRCVAVGRRARRGGHAPGRGGGDGRVRRPGFGRSGSSCPTARPRPGRCSIRVNAILPGVVDTPMVMNDAFMSLALGREGGTREDMVAAGRTMHPLPTGLQDASEMANAVVRLSPDEARFVTGVALPVEAGLLNSPPAGRGPCGGP